MLWKNDKKIAAMKKINIKILFQNLNQRNKVTFWKNIYSTDFDRLNYSWRVRKTA